MSLKNNERETSAASTIEDTTASISSTITENVQNGSVPSLSPDEATAKKSKVTDPEYRKYTLDTRIKISPIIGYENEDV